MRRVVDEGKQYFMIWRRIGRELGLKDYRRRKEMDKGW